MKALPELGVYVLIHLKECFVENCCWSVAKLIKNGDFSRNKEHPYKWQFAGITWDDHMVDGWDYLPEEKCKDWKEGIEKINAPIILQTVRSGEWKYDGKAFVFCPWCGEKLKEAK